MQPRSIKVDLDNMYYEGTLIKITAQERAVVILKNKSYIVVPLSKILDNETSFYPKK